MSEGTAAKFNFIVSGVLMASPWWLETLTNVSTVAALMLPIIGAAVGFAQLYKLLRK